MQLIYSFSQSASQPSKTKVSLPSSGSLGTQTIVGNLDQLQSLYIFASLFDICFCVDVIDQFEHD